MNQNTILLSLLVGVTLVKCLKNIVLILFWGFYLYLYLKNHFSAKILNDNTTREELITTKNRFFMADFQDILSTLLSYFQPFLKQYFLNLTSS